MEKGQTEIVRQAACLSRRSYTQADRSPHYCHHEELENPRCRREFTIVINKKITKRTHFDFHSQPVYQRLATKLYQTFDKNEPILFGSPHSRSAKLFQPLRGDGLWTTLGEGG